MSELHPTVWRNAFESAEPRNCGKNAKKNTPIFGFRRSTRIPRLKNAHDDTTKPAEPRGVGRLVVSRKRSPKYTRYVAPVYFRTINAVSDATIRAATPVAAARTCTKIPTDIPTTEMIPALTPFDAATPDTYRMDGPGERFTANVAARNTKNVSGYMCFRSSCPNDELSGGASRRPLEWRVIQ